MTLRKNPRYWRASELRMEQIDAVMVSSDTALRMFEEGALDWVGSPLGALPVDAVSALKSDGRICSCPFLATKAFFLQTREFVEGCENPLHRLAVRRALAAALDREAIAVHLLQGGQRAATRFVPPELYRDALHGECDEHKSATPDVDVGENVPPITILFISDPVNASLVQAVQKQWEEKLRISVVLQALDRKTFWQRVARGDFQIALGSWTADVPDSLNFLEILAHEGSSPYRTGWCDLRYRDLLRRAQLFSEEGARDRLLKEAEDLLLDEAPLIPLYHYAMNYLKKDGLQGVVVSPLGYVDFRGAYWEEM